MYNNSSSIRQWAEEDRPREKLLLKGKRHLSNAELLAIIIAHGTREKTALDLAKEVLTSNKQNLKSVASLKINELLKYKGIGVAKAVSLIAAFELGRRWEATPQKKRTQINSSNSAFNFVNSLMSDLEHEEFRVLMLNRGNFLIKIETISIGGMAGTVVDPKIIFRKALETGASSLILVHNHPSGNIKPSEADKAITQKLTHAADHLDIKILDHLIVGRGAYYSFADEGLI